MTSGDDAVYQQSWQHLMGALDELMAQVRDNVSQLVTAEHDLERLLDEAGQLRTTSEAAFRLFMDHRERLAQLLDRLQRELAVAGVPLKGDII